MSCLTETPGPTGASLAWQPTHGGRLQVACTGNPWEEDGPDEEMGGYDPPLDNPPPKGKAGTRVLPGGGGKAGRGSSSDEESDHEYNDNEEDPEESREEDLVNGQVG